MTTVIPDRAITGAVLREEIARQFDHIGRLEAALLPLAHAPISAGAPGAVVEVPVTQQAVVDARKLLGIHHGLVTDDAAVATTMRAWQRWLANAKPAAPGQRAAACLYYAGYLAGSMYVPRSHGAGRPAETEVEKPVVAAAAFDAYEHGLVHLVQVKTAPGDFDYYAIRARPAAAVAAKVAARRKAA